MYLRNFWMLLQRYTASSLLNMAGMALAFASAYLILVQVEYDLSYNRTLPAAERIFRLESAAWGKQGFFQTNLPRQQPDELLDGIPEVEIGASMNMADGYVPTYEYSIRRNATIENFTLDLSSTEREGLDLFGFEIIDGSLDDFLGPDRLILSESTARRLQLGPGDVLLRGRGAESDNSCTVVAVYRDFEQPSTIAGVEGYVGLIPQQEASRGNWNDSYFVRLREGASPDAVLEKMHANFLVQYAAEGTPDEVEKTWSELTYRFSPLSQLHFLSDISDENLPYTARRSTTRILLCIAVLIVVIAFINFFNFFFALIPVRIRAVNTYKIFGAPTAKLRLNFLFETAGLVGTALVIAAGIVILAGDSPLARFLPTSISLAQHGSIVGALLGVTLGFGLLVSLYPAWYITKFPPAFVIKGSFQATPAGRALRYLLVGFQYVISILLIICAIFVQLQHHHMMTFDMGFDREQLLTVDVPMQLLAGQVYEDGQVKETAYQRRDQFSDRLKQNPMIRDVAYSNVPIIQQGGMSWGRPYKDQVIHFSVLPVSWNFPEVMGIELLEGHYFVPSDEQKLQGTLIFNEEAARRYGITTDDTVQGHVYGKEADVAAICRNFNFRPASVTIEPMALIVYGQYAWAYARHAYIRTAAGADLRAVRDHITRTIAEAAPAADPASYEVTLFDRELEQLYRREQNLSVLIFLFSLLSIAISMMGVFGLVLFETQYRRREIGIRRVCGATVGSILLLFNRRFLAIVAVCSAIAVPLSIVILRRWLQQFAYRTPLSAWVFAAAVLIVAAITLATVTSRSHEAASENPVDAIKH